MKIDLVFFLKEFLVLNHLRMGPVPTLRRHHHHEGGATKSGCAG